MEVEAEVELEMLAADDARPTEVRCLRRKTHGPLGLRARSGRALGAGGAKDRVACARVVCPPRPPRRAAFLLAAPGTGPVKANSKPSRDGLGKHPGGTAPRATGRAGVLSARNWRPAFFKNLFFLFRPMRKRRRAGKRGGGAPCAGDRRNQSSVAPEMNPKGGGGDEPMPGRRRRLGAGPSRM